MENLEIKEEGTELEEEIQPEVTEEKKPVEEVESWMADDEPEQNGESQTVPLGAHVKAKHKLRGKITEQDNEIKALRAKVEQLEGKKDVPLELPKRPRRNDFDDDDSYEKALDVYEDTKDRIKFKTLQTEQSVTVNQQKFAETIEKAVNSHYERADNLINSHGISAEAFKAADQDIRESIDLIRPGVGDVITDQLISKLGEGSEKVMFRIGRSKVLKNELVQHLLNDPSGIDAAIFLGQQKSILLNTKKRISNAPPPDDQINGNEDSGKKEEILKKRYQDAHRSGKGQIAFNARREAKKMGYDISKW